MKRALVLLGLGVAVGLSNRAYACGGGLVTRAGGTTAADAQRIYLSVGDTSTEVVTTIRVPAAQEDFGVLLPLPATPTLDPEPVPSAEMDRLIRATDPLLLIPQAGGGVDDGGCGCGDVAGGDKSAGPQARGPQVGPPVTIGPVTAVVLDATSAAAVQAWLTENSFAVPAGSEALVASHSGAGRTFVALRRTPAAAGQPTSATSVGVHFTLPGDQRMLPMRFARMGAGAMVSFTVFVAAKTGVATALPFETLALAAVNPTMWRTQSYDSALAMAVSQRANHAFVVEKRIRASELTSSGGLGQRLASLTPPTHTITRLSTRVPATALDSDAEFSIPAEGTADNIVVGAGLVLGAGDAGTGPRGGTWKLAGLFMGALLLWRVLRRPRRFAMG